MMAHTDSQTLVKYVAVRLVTPISKIRRHVTLGMVQFHWITMELLNNHSLTMTSTLKENKREIPPIFFDKKLRK